MSSSSEPTSEYSSFISSSPSEKYESHSKRKRSCSISRSTSSRERESKKRRNRYQSPDWHKKKDINPTDFLCLYKKEHRDIPAYIKKGDKVLKCVQFKRNGDFTQLDLQTLNRRQKEHMKCIVGCTEIMLNGLSVHGKEIDDSMIRCWVDDISNADERVEKSYKVEGKFHQLYAITAGLRRFYESLLDGFGNGEARNGVLSIIQICRNMLDEREEVVLDNCGGALKYKGSIQIAKLYHRFSKECTEYEKRIQASVILNLEKAEIKSLIPDLTVSRNIGGEKSFYLFAECKAVGGDYNIGKYFSQVWHQSLRGLSDKDYVYGCVVNGFQGALLKMKVKNDSYETDFVEYDFFKVVRSKNGTVRTFNICAFKDFLKGLTRIIQDILQT